jgi:hypothetical protein
MSDPLQLLPAFYRVRDARPDDRPGFLASLVELIGEQFDAVGEELDQLYDDLFIETCAPWVVAYIGDLVGVLPGAGDEALPRAAVADAIALRRRKGTVPVLEQLAQDLTGWPALAVESFPRLAITQTIRHLVPQRGHVIELRQAGPLERLGGAFDAAAHRDEVRRIGSGRGRFNVPNVAVFVWRDLALPHSRVEAAGVDAKRFRFRPLGFDGALITRPRPEVTLDHSASSLDLPVPVTRRAMAADPGDYYGAGASAAVWLAGAANPVPLADIVVCDLSDRVVGGWSNVDRLPATAVGIDPALGRLAFGTDQAGPPLVSFYTSAPADTGGSELTAPTGGPAATVVVEHDGPAGTFPDLVAGLAASAGQGVVEVRDSRRHEGDPSITVPADGELRVRAAAGRQPLVALGTQWTVTVAEGGQLVLEGLVVAGAPVVVRGRPQRIELHACTLVPGFTLGPDASTAPPVNPSLVVAVDSDWQTEVILDNCVTGPLAIPADGTRLTATDSIVDSVGDGHVGAAPGRVVPVLCSADLGAGPLPVPAGSTSMVVTVGAATGVPVDLGAAPVDPANAAQLLDAALRASAPLAGVRAVLAGTRLVVLAGEQAVRIDDPPGGTLATDLGLTGAAEHRRAVLGGPADPGAVGPAGRYAVTGGTGLSHELTVAGPLATAAALAAAVQAALQAVPDSASYTAAGVGVLDGRLVVLPGSAEPLVFSAVATDSVTAAATGLASPRPAIAADPAGGPGATLNLARCTVFGAVSTVDIDTVTDTVFTGPLTSARQQVGCVQYSWLPPGSVTPRRHQCQPVDPSVPPPQFVSQRYGTPGYARLRRAGATALVRGASTGGEMGAYARLRQTQRDDNLRWGIAEFLRFGLEAGVLDGD